jgi:hypothetical protein
MSAKEVIEIGTKKLEKAKQLLSSRIRRKA